MRRCDFLLTDGSGFTAIARPHPGPRLLSPTPLHGRQRRQDWGGIPERLGFGVGGRDGSYIGGGRWVGRRDRAPNAWRPFAAANMAARPRPFHGSTRG
jgi:hypothetical protein